MGLFGRAWARYRRRKSVRGIVIDFALLVVVIVLAVAPLRRGVLTYALRVVAAQPDAYEHILFASPADSFVVRTPCGADTTIHFPPARPTLINVASVWSPQSRAELKSLNKAASLWPQISFLVIVSSDEADDMARYLARKKYTSLRLLTVDDDSEAAEEKSDEARAGLRNDVINSIPATILLDANGQVVIKKLGSAKWTGKRVEAIYSDVVSGGR